MACTLSVFFVVKKANAGEWFGFTTQVCNVQVTTINKHLITVYIHLIFLHNTKTCSLYHMY